MARVVGILTAAMLAVAMLGCERDEPVGDKPSSSVVLLKHDDFGCPAIANELIGVHWYQWDPCGYEEDDYQYNIKVVVYDGMSLEEAQRRYPTVKNEIDYRYVARDRAVAFLKEKIHEIANLTNVDMGKIEDGGACERAIAAELQVTLDKIEAVTSGVADESNSTKPVISVIANWDRIKPSMSPDEVIAVLGMPHRSGFEGGILISGNDTTPADLPFMYAWDEAGIRYTAHFDHFAVISTETKPLPAP